MDFKKLAEKRNTIEERGRMRASRPMPRTEEIKEPGAKAGDGEIRSLREPTTPATRPAKAARRTPAD